MRKNTRGILGGADRPRRAHWEVVSGLAHDTTTGDGNLCVLRAAGILGGADRPGRHIAIGDSNLCARRGRRAPPELMCRAGPLGTSQQGRSAPPSRAARHLPVGPHGTSRWVFPGRYLPGQLAGGRVRMVSRMATAARTLVTRSKRKLRRPFLSRMATSRGCICKYCSSRPNIGL